MTYIISLFIRFINAIKKLKFWAECLMVFGFSGLGIWWPIWFEWKGYGEIFYPEPWFTYGLATLMIIVGQRFFMKESDDQHIMSNRFVLIILSLIGSIMYGKSVIKYLEFIPTDQNNFDYSLTKYACTATVCAWIIHFIGKNEYDNINNTDVLGGKV